MNLRPYQIDLVERIRETLRSGVKRACIVAPTGAGKTQIFSYLAGRSAANGSRVWIVVHRVELARQTSATLTAWGVPHGRIAAGQRYDGQAAQIVAVDTLAARLRSGAATDDRPDLLIIDECDLAAAATWQRVIAACPFATVLGFTATPQRLDGKGLGSLFQTLILGPSVEFLMGAGFLARPAYYGVKTAPDLTGVKRIAGDYDKTALDGLADSPCLTGDIVATYARICPGSRFVGFAVSVKHAKRLAELFTWAGFPSAVISSETKDRASLTDALRAGKLTGLWTVDIFGRGVDVPAIETGILARPTASLALHLQQVGRVLRPAEGKVARILDHAGNLHRHGLAETARAWALEGVHKKTRVKEMLEAIRQCQACWGWSAPAPVCPQCGAPLPAKQRATKEQAGTLEKLTAEEVETARQAAVQAASARKACKTFADLVALGKRTGKKPGWAWHVWRGRK